MIETPTTRDKLHALLTTASLEAIADRGDPIDAILNVLAGSGLAVVPVESVPEPTNLAVEAYQEGAGQGLPSSIWTAKNLAHIDMRIYVLLIRRLGENTRITAEDLASITDDEEVWRCYEDSDPTHTLILKAGTSSGPT